jgi:LeuA-like protein with dimerisation domain
MTVSPIGPIPETSSLAVERWAASSGSERTSRANLTIVGGGHRWRANAAGNGAVDALMRAVDRALEPLLGEGVVLVSYDVHAAGVGHEAKAAIAVGVRRRDADDGPIYPGRAVHDNVLQASVGAYLDAVNALLRDEGIDVAAAIPSPGGTDRHETDPDHRSGIKDDIMSAYNS